HADATVHEKIPLHGHGDPKGVRTEVVVLAARPRQVATREIMVVAEVQPVETERDREAVVDRRDGAVVDERNGRSQPAADAVAGEMVWRTGPTERQVRLELDAVVGVGAGLLDLRERRGREQGDD